MTSEARKGFAELKRRSRRLVGFRRSNSGYNEQVIYESGICVTLNSDGAINISVEDPDNNNVLATVLVLRADDYAPTATSRLLDLALRRLRKLMGRAV